MTTIWMMIIMLGMSIPAMGAMSISKMRQNARFLTDKMTYELGLSMMQYDDVYEVNYDFINNVRYIMDDVVRGYGYAVDRYYEYLDYRNDDLRWILSASQYRAFMRAEHFYRPIYTTKSHWVFRIFNVYTDAKHFYYGKPKHYKSYKGEHFRTHYGNKSYYQHHRKDTYKHKVYQGPTKIDRKPMAPKNNKKVQDNNRRRTQKVTTVPDHNTKRQTTSTSKTRTTKRAEVKKETKRTEVKSPAKRTEVKTDAKRTTKRTASQGKTSTRTSESRKATNRGSR